MSRTSEKPLGPLRLLILFAVGIGILAVVVFGETRKLNERSVVIKEIREHGGSVVLGEPTKEQSPWQLRYWIQSLVDDNHASQVYAVQHQLQTEEDLTRILALDEMGSLSLKGDLDPSLLNKIRKLPFLEYLSFEQATIDALTVENLAGLSSLKTLDLRECNLTVPLLDALAALPLELSLSFDSQPLPDELLLALSKTNSLRRLQIDHCKMDNSRLQLLCGSSAAVVFSLDDSEVTTLGLAKLLPLNKGWSIELHCKNAARADSTLPNRFPPVDAMDDQTRLDFSGSCIDDALFECIGPAQNLQTLGLGNCSITDKGMARLQEFAELKQLSIASKTLTDEGLEPVGHLSNLERLFVNAGAVNGKFLDALPVTIRSLHLRAPLLEPSSVGVLTRLSRLEELTLEGANITDVSLESLSAFPSLQSLTLYDTSVSKEAVASFKSRSPTCRVIHE